MTRLRALEIRGFRAFSEPQRLEFEGQLALVWAPNSQGKTSIAEAIEFLLTGHTARRELLGGAKAEFDAALRNAHLDPGAPVLVRGWICDDRGVEHEVCRTLTADYDGDRDCDSLLTIDGVVADDLSALGIELADPPLRGPVLLPHTLRFALSARPQERADYFKAVLEVADLEHLRDLVVAERDRRSQSPAPAPLAAFRSACAALPALADVRSALETGALDEGTVERVLARGADLGGAALGAVVTPGPLTEKLEALRAAVGARRERAFPMAAYRAGPVPVLSAPDLAALSEYAAVLAEVDQETERLVAVFEAILAVPAIAGATEAVTCPVCGTSEALTTERIAELRAQVSRSRGMARARDAAAGVLDRLAGDLARLRLAVDGAAPAAAGLPPDEVAVHANAAERLLGTAEPHGQALSALESVRVDRDRVTSALGAALGAVQSAAQAVTSTQPLDAEQLAAALDTLNARLAELAASRTDYDAAAARLLEPLAGAADREAGTGDWTRFAEVASDPVALRRALLDMRAARAGLAALERAVDDLDGAKARVFDRKFEAMSAEIDRWWRLLRPDEPVTFDSVRRRGTGRRYVSFKVRLHPHTGAPGVERDALGVFSDSQLNALGLAAFLARCRRQGAPLVVLDDPVQAGDEEHRVTFVGPVLEQLLADGVQIILLSYDDMTNRLVHDLYRDLPLDGFSASLDAPIRGVTVMRTANTAEALWQRAGACLISDVAEIREVAANKLRVAAERIAKEILVASRRAAGDSCSLADYEGMTLGPLAASLEPFLREPSHAGKWRVVRDLLNPGSHDDAPPSRNDLRQSHGYLREFLRYYLAPDRGRAVAP